MSLAIAITVTDAKLTANALPPRAGSTTASTMATGDQAIVELGEAVRKQVANLLMAADSNSMVNCTVTATVT